MREREREKYKVGGWNRKKKWIRGSKNHHGDWMGGVYVCVCVCVVCVWPSITPSAREVEFFVSVCAGVDSYREEERGGGNWWSGGVGGDRQG